MMFTSTVVTLAVGVDASDKAGRGSSRYGSFFSRRDRRDQREPTIWSSDISCRLLTWTYWPIVVGKGELERGVLE